MLKNILNLKGAQQLSNNEQKEIVGAAKQINYYCVCSNGTVLGVVSSHAECERMRMTECYA
jgi:hypothetical protein